MSYNRTAPRDVFNEANFLKCIARILELINLGKLRNIKFQANSLQDNWVVFEQDLSSGDLVVGGLFVRASDGEPITLSRNLNTRDPWPLYIQTEEWEVYDVFTSNGEASSEIEEYLGEGDNHPTPESIQSEIYDQAMYMKANGKLALLCIDEVLPKELTFDEELYATNGMSIICRAGWCDTKAVFFKFKGKPLVTRRAMCTSHDWLLTTEHPTKGVTTVFDSEGNICEHFKALIDLSDED